MSFAFPAYTIHRQSIVGMEGMFAKMFDPPRESPATPDRVAPTNPVPELMAARGFQNPPTIPHTVQRDLLHGMSMPAWEGPNSLNFMVFGDKNNPLAAGGTWPGPTIRVPRGVIFHCQTKGQSPPPHTIHWHGIEPTPMNDGVGHCSMELGEYTYQFQPNFIGTYFYHCHRNTVQHFEFGLYGMLIIEPPDAYFATLQNPAIPIGACRDGKRRAAANLAEFPQFPGFNSNPIDIPDPLGQYPADPHAMTVPYDVEALWVPDDRDSNWSDLGSNAKATFPALHSGLTLPTPGVDDEFHGHAGVPAVPTDFFAFNDFNADYWFVTGVPVRAHQGGTAAIDTGVVVPEALNSGVSGMQVSINAQVGQTILVRCLDAAYNSLAVTFPVDAVLIAWDGRALGVPPFGRYTKAYQVPAGTRIDLSTARRFDALIRPTHQINSFATVEFIDTRGQVPGTSETVLVTAKIPINIAPATTVVGEGAFTISGRVSSLSGAPLAGVTVTLAGAANRTVVTNGAGSYTLEGLPNGNYSVTPSLGNSTIKPASRNVTLSGADVVGQDFQGQFTVYLPQVSKSGS